MNKRYLSLIAAIAWLIISIILLTLPGTAFPQENWLDKIWADKWIHIGMFGLMVILWCWAWLSSRLQITSAQLPRHLVVIAIIFLCYGIAMEFVQLYFVAHRSFDIGDIVADAIGCATGLMLSRWYIKKTRGI